jgi:hypothetical protein
MIHKFKFASLLALLIAVLGTIGAPVTASAACSAATIENTYGFRHNGFSGPAAATALKVSSFVPVAG